MLVDVPLEEQAERRKELQESEQKRYAAEVATLTGAEAGLRQDFQEFQASIADRLRVPASELPTDLGTDSKGNIAVATTKYEELLYPAIREEMARERGYSSWQQMPYEMAQRELGRPFDSLSGAERKPFIARQQEVPPLARKEAQQIVRRAAQGKRHLVFVDMEPEETTRRIAALPPFIREAAAALTPKAAITITPTAEEYEPERYGEHLFRILVNASSAVKRAKLDAWAQSGGPDDLAEAFATATDDPERSTALFWSAYKKGWSSIWGATPEQAEDLVRRIREDENAMGYAAQQMGALAEANDMSPEVVTWAKRAGYAAGFWWLEVPTPATFEYALAAAGIGAKALGRRAAREVPLERAFEKIATTEGIPYEMAERIVRDVDPAAATLYEMRIAIEGELPQPVKDYVRNAKQAADAAHNRAEALAEKLKTAPEDTGLLAQLREAEREAAVARAASAAADARAAELVTAETRRAGTVEVAERTVVKHREARAASDDLGKKAAAVERENKAGLDAVEAAKQRFATEGETYGAAKMAHDAAWQAKKTAIQDARATTKQAKAELDDAVKARQQARGAFDEAQKATPARGQEKAALAKVRDTGLAFKKADTAAAEATETYRVALETEKRLTARGLKGRAGPLSALDQPMAEARAAMEAAEPGYKAAKDAYEIALRENSGAVEQLAKLRKQAARWSDLADRYAESLRMGGVDPYATGKTVYRQIQDGMEARAKGARAHATAMAGKSKEAANAVRETDAAFEQVLKAGAEEFKGQVHQRIARDMADEIRRGRDAWLHFRERTPPAMFEDVLAPATVGGRATTTGTERTVEVRALLDDLGKKYGEDSVRYVASRGGDVGRLLQRLAQQVDGGGRAVVPLTASEVAKLQDLPRYLEIAQRRVHPESAAIDTLEALELARKDLDFLQPSSVTGQVLLKARKFWRTFEPVRGHIGHDVRPDVADIVKSAGRMSAQSQDELITLTRKARAGDVDEATARFMENDLGLRPPETGPAAEARRRIGYDTPDERMWVQVGAILRYMDTTDPLHYIGGQTMMNTMSTETIWQAGRRFVLWDDRARPFGAELKRWADQADEALQAGREPPTMPTMPKDQSVGAQAIVQALSRAWLPERTVTSDIAGARLYNAAMELLAESKAAGGTFKDFMLAMRGKTKAVLRTGRLETAMGRAFAYSARAMLHGRVLDETNQLLVRAVGGVLTPEQAKAMQRFLARDYEHGGGEGWKQAVEGFNALGAPITLTRRTKVETAVGGEPGELLNRLVKTGANPEGDAYWMTNAMAVELDRGLGKVIKDLGDVTPTGMTPSEALGFSAQKTALSMWRTYVVTGLIYPRGAYWVNNVVGDFEQMWFTLGPVTAINRSVRNLPMNVPLLGRLLADHGAEMAKKYQGKPVLGSVFGALFNPDLGAIWRGSKGVLRTRHGAVVPLDDVRKWAVEDGITDTFIHEEMMNAFTRVTKSWVWSRVTGWQDMIAAHANFVQQRQRMGLYVDLLQQGYRRDETRRLTLSALYDWKHAVADWESRMVTSKLPFYRWLRLAMAQSWSAFSDPITRPVGENLMKLASGQTKLNRMRQIMIARDNLPDFVHPEEEGQSPEGMSPAEIELATRRQQDEMARHMYPEWMRANGVYSVEPTKEEYYDSFLQQRGRIYPYMARRQPPGSIADSFGIMASVATAGAGLVAALTGRNDILAPDWEETLIAPVTGMMFPWLRDPLQQWLSSMMVDSGSVSKGSSATITPGEALLLSRMKAMFGSDWWQVRAKDELGERRANKWTVFALRTLPPSAMVAGLSDTYKVDNPAWSAYRRRLTAGNVRLNQAQALADQAGRTPAGPEYDRLVAEYNAKMAEANELRAWTNAPKADEVWAYTSWVVQRFLGQAPYPFDPAVGEDIRSRAIKDWSKAALEAHEVDPETVEFLERPTPER